jgi:MFS family permease
VTKNGYRELFSSPGFARVVGSQLFARFPFGMMSLALVMHIQHIYGNYTTAGLALGAETIGASLSNPLLGRMMGNYGIRKILLPSAVISALAVFAVTFVSGSEALTVMLALLIGVFSPPVQAAARTVYPTIVKKRQLPLLFSFDAASQEIIWVIGPVLATILAAQYNTYVPVITMGVLQILGAISFVANPEVSTAKIPKSTRRMGGVLKNKVLVLNIALGMLLIGSFSGVEVGTVAIFPKSLAGGLMAMLSIGSLIGGFAFGKRTQGRYALISFLSLTTLGYGLVLVAPENPYWVAFCWFLAGLGVAPVLGILGTMISVTVKLSDTAEAFGWAGTGQLIGYSVGAALAGIMIDTIAPTAAVGIAAVLGLSTLILAISTLKIAPDLKAAANTDTKGITIVEE